jgi:hypothetical protein
MIPQQQNAGRFDVIISTINVAGLLGTLRPEM